jgi:hypothetical protein
MSRIEYDLLRAERPDLRLPEYQLLYDDSREKVEISTRDQVISARFGQLLRRDPGVTDRLRMIPKYE